MLQAIDSKEQDRIAQRREWLSVLARAPLAMLERAIAPYDHESSVWLRRPETGLYMVQGRAGGTGERFNVGEVTVTRCALRLRGSTNAATVGVAYVIGRSHRQAHLAALADALLQDEDCRADLQEQLLQPVTDALSKEAKAQARKAQATRVEFFTVARETSNADESEDA